MRLRILVEEEYGYRYWLWEVNAKSKQGIALHFRSVVDKGDTDYWYCSGTPSEWFSGDWKEIEFREYRDMRDKQDFDALAHVHQDDDSHIHFREDSE